MPKTLTPQAQVTIDSSNSTYVDPVEAAEPVEPSDTGVGSAVLPYHPVTHEHWIALSKLLGYNLETSTDLVRRVQHLSTITVEGIEIQLPPALMQRIRTRAYKADQVPKLLQNLVVNLLSEELG